MKAIISVENKIDQLLGCLDKDIQHVQQTLSRLNELRSLVIKRDDVSLGKLLENIQADSDDYASNESQRQSIRKELAFALDCDVRQVTLSKLEKIAAGEKKNQLAKRKTKLRTLAEELKKELAGTAMLLSDCARFNSMLLKTFLGSTNNEPIFYSASGAVNQQGDMALVNLKF